MITDLKNGGKIFFLCFLFMISIFVRVGHWFSWYKSNHDDTRVVFGLPLCFDNLGSNLCEAKR